MMVSATDNELSIGLVVINYNLCNQYRCESLCFLIRIQILTSKCKYTLLAAPYFLGIVLGILSISTDSRFVHKNINGLLFAMLK